jgi:IS30 family transposase
MNYQQLIEGKRYHISALLGQEISVTTIARTLNCYRATIYRELKRNKKVSEYCPDKAQRACLVSLKNSNRKLASQRKNMWVTTTV